MLRQDICLGPATTSDSVPLPTERTTTGRRRWLDDVTIELMWRRQSAEWLGIAASRKDSRECCGLTEFVLLGVVVTNWNWSCRRRTTSFEQSGLNYSESLLRLHLGFLVSSAIPTHTWLNNSRPITSLSPSREHHYTVNPTRESPFFVRERRQHLKKSRQ